VAMIAPRRNRCGVTDYTEYLTGALLPIVASCVTIDPKDYLAGRTDADILHVQHQYFLFGGVAPWRNRFRHLLRSIDRPAVMTVHEFVSPAGKPHVRAAIRLTNRMQFGSPKIARLLVHTEEDRDRMTSQGCDENRVFVVRHGVPRRPALQPKEDAKRALGLEGRFVVTLFGFLSRRKGHGIAIEAMRNVPPNSVLLLAGGRHPDDTSDYPEMLETMINSSDLRDRVRITGYLEADTVSQVMAATDLVIAPFTESSGSGSLALGLACGKAILASDIAPHREMVREEPDSVLVVKNDPGTFGEAITRMMAADAERKRLETGASRYASSHTYDQMARETLTVYFKVLRGAAA
jgi:glycosyltransferase involved in cell wall biosynthesis